MKINDIVTKTPSSYCNAGLGRVPPMAGRVMYIHPLGRFYEVEFRSAVTGETYTQHSPGFADGKKAFKDGITGFLKEFPESSAEIRHIGADGDLVFIHNHIKLNARDRGQAAVDIFRVKDGKIVEHWDVIQDIPEKAENQNTMF